MVFQRETRIPIWGWANRGEKIEVTLGGRTATTTADVDGRWKVVLEPLPASSKPLRLTVVGENRVEIEDVLIGEVWLCSGQSNMEWRVRQTLNAQGEIAAAKFPLIRHVKIPRRPSAVPLDDVEAAWQVCSPETVAEFTACGYYMARQLHLELDVPIGLVNSSWGGTRVEPWTPPSGFEKLPELEDIYLSVMGRTPGTEAYRSKLGDYLASVRSWLKQAEDKQDSRELLPAIPSYPADLVPFKSHQDPSMLYNGMIHALVGFPIRGAIWYQGESNHRERLYTEKKQALINGWRKLWGQGDFPFYYVQIAPFQYGDEDPAILAEFWEQQAAVQQRVVNSGMVVINDIATLNDIHPPNKQDVGKRLALWALKNDYGRKDIVARSPEPAALGINIESLKVDFKFAAGGLKTRDGKAPTHFELIGPDSNGFQPAFAQIDGSSVILTSDAVQQPTGVRFAWHKLAEPNLVGPTGLPVGAFRAGEVPEFLSTIPGSSEYRLVYDLDLDQLQAEVPYKVDHSDQVGRFDRIAYLLELESNRFGKQHLFVSMKAFTDDATKIGIPTLKSRFRFQQQVEDMDVFSNSRELTTGTGIATGNIEFWPNNYAPNNRPRVKGASAAIYDFGDQIGTPRDGYGSMQVHNFGAAQTVFSINNWKQGAAADIGIGNSPGENRDWTFSRNAASYTRKRLRVLVRPVAVAE